MTRANPKIVGLFIIGGALLLLLAVSALVSGKLFTHATTYVAFFPESVRGLQIGSPVTFRGVPLGQVKGIEAFMNPKETAIDIEVTFEVNLERIHNPSGANSELHGLDAAELVKVLSGKGLRAELQSTSLVTGQLYIDLDFHPEQPPRMLDIPTRYPQIPTAPTKLALLGSRIEKIATTLADLPLDRVANDLSAALVAVRDLARSPEIRQAFASANVAGKDLSRAIANVDLLVNDIRSKVGEADVKQVVSDVHATLVAAEKGLEQIRTTLSGTAGAQRELSHTLSEIARAAAAIRVLADYLERNPSALLGGKPAPAK